MKIVFSWLAMALVFFIGYLSSSSILSWCVFWCLLTALLIIQYYITAINRNYSKYISTLFLFWGYESTLICCGSIIDATAIERGALGMGYTLPSIYLFIILMFITFPFVSIWFYSRSNYSKISHQLNNLDYPLKKEPAKMREKR